MEFSCVVVCQTLDPSLLFHEGSRREHRRRIEKAVRRERSDVRRGIGRLGSETAQRVAITGGFLFEVAIDLSANALRVPTAHGAVQALQIMARRELRRTREIAPHGMRFPILVSDVPVTEIIPFAIENNRADSEDLAQRLAILLEVSPLIVAKRVKS